MSIQHFSNLQRLSGIIIVDFDNFFNKPIELYTSEAIEYELKQIVALIIEKNEELEEIIIRLYGGWYKDEILTHRASILQQSLANINLLPYINPQKMRKVTGKIEIATSLFYLPDLVWKNTYKEKNGIPRLRIKDDLLNEICESNSSLCPPKILNKFTKDKSKACSVNECSIVHKEIFKGMEQKMVDTMMVCDIISFSDEDLVTEVIILSNDTDIIPSIVYAKEKSQRDINYTLIIRNEQLLGFCEQYLKPFNISVKLIQNEY